MLYRLLLRMAGTLPVLLLVAAGIFALLRLAPGDAAALLAADDASEEDIAQLRAQWGLDQPVSVQFATFVWRIARLDLGTSVRYQEPVASLILERLPATFELALAGLLLAVLVGVPLGLLAALRKGKATDSAVSLIAVAGVSAPSFWVGILLVLLFSAQLNLLPSGGRLPFEATIVSWSGFNLIDSLLQGQWRALGDTIAHLLLPAGTLALGMAGIVARITRSAVIDAGQEEFIVTAIAKGLGRAAIVRSHLLPNAAIPIVTIIGLELGALMSGTIIVEVIFSWPGVGTLLYQAVSVRDTALTIGVVVVYTTLFIVLNMLIDLLYVILDPRLRTA